MCICPQKVGSSGKSTARPSRSSSRTTARPVCGNRVSLKQVTKRETRTRLPFRKVFGLDGREVTAGAGPSWGEGPPPQTEGAAERQPTDLGPLVKELRGAVGAEHVFTHEHQLRTYESDGLLQYAVTPGAVALPDSSAEVQAVVRACHRAGVSFV